MIYDRFVSMLIHTGAAAIFGGPESDQTCSMALSRRPVIRIDIAASLGRGAALVRTTKKLIVQDFSVSCGDAKDWAEARSVSPRPIEA